VGLHNFSLYTVYALIYCNVLVNFITLFFMITISFGVFLFSSKPWILKNLGNSTLTTFVYFNVLVVALLFVLKFYISYNITITYSEAATTASSLFSDTLVLLAIVVTFVSWYYLSERFLFRSSFFIIYFFVFVFCTVNMVYTTNLLVMFIFFELIFLPSLFFVYRFGYSKRVEKTINFLLLWTLTGSFIALFTFLYIMACCKSLELTTLNMVKFSYLEQTFISLFFFIGFGIKIPVWPFHYWLTKVHVEAPTGFSIFLSGFLVKTAFFCFSYVYIIFTNKVATLVCVSIVVWGALDSSIRMWTSNDIKRLIAFATIQEMNLILLFLLLNSNSNFNVLNIFLLMHGLLSAFLFYLVDNVQKRFQSRNLVTLSGLSSLSPQLHTFIWCGILIFRGFPLFIKLVIEWELLTSLLTAFEFLGFFIFFVISFLGVTGFCRIWFSVLYGQPTVVVSGGVDILRKDLYIGYFLIISLSLLNFIAFLF